MHGAKPPTQASSLSAAASQAFQRWPNAAGRLVDLSSGVFPTIVSAWSGGPLELAAGGTHFGFVTRGPARLSVPAGQFDLAAGMYFAVPGTGRVEGAAGVVMTRLGFAGLFQLGGPVEATGRLRYLNGCSDTLLVPPVTRGDPCLNLLHVVPHTDQTAHTHPSLRAGVVVRGAGRCLACGTATDLSAGDVFLIPADCLHSFHTGDDSLLVAAYHPDSDFGPTHEDHPMLNRTLVDGVSMRGLRDGR